MDDEGEDWSRTEEEEKSLGFQDAYKEKSDLEKDLEDRRGMRNRLILFSGRSRSRVCGDGDVFRTGKARCGCCFFSLCGVRKFSFFVTSATRDEDLFLSSKRSSQEILSSFFLIQPSSLQPPPAFFHFS
jgi:hypothetical protein